VINRAIKIFHQQLIALSLTVQQGLPIRKWFMLVLLLVWFVFISHILHEDKSY